MADMSSSSFSVASENRRPPRHDTVRIDFSLLKQKLYGREAEKRLLIKAYEEETPQVVKLYGYSGSGKSSLVNWLRNEVVLPSGGMFGAGKFERLRSPAHPWHAVTEAFSDLCKQVLDGSDKELRQISIREAMGGRERRVLARSIPSLCEMLQLQDVGTDSSSNASTAPMPEMAPSKFSLTQMIGAFRALLRAIVALGTPTVFFLDDIQWSDSASIQLIQALARDDQIKNGLTLILAYRDNEVGPTHPVTLMLRAVEDIRQVRSVPVTGLTVEALSEMLAALLTDSGNESEVESLTKIIHKRTNGNAFFSIQMLRLLQEEGLLFYSMVFYKWEWDADRIQSETQITENVVDLVMKTLRRLPEMTQNVLKIGACFGTHFDVNLLTSIVEKSNSRTEEAKEDGNWFNRVCTCLRQVDIADVLEEAVTQDLVARQKETRMYKFLHDRIHQAVYNLLPEGREREELHLWVGGELRSLIAGLGDDSPKLLLLVVHQLNRGAPRMEDSAARIELARLNLRAARFVISSSAFFLAVAHLETGVKLLESEGGWATHGTLMMEMKTLLGELYTFVGQIDNAKATVKEALANCRRLEDKTRPHRTLMMCLQAEGEFSELVEVAVEALREYGETLTSRPQMRHVVMEFLRARRAVGKRSDQELLTLPAMVDRGKIAVMSILGVTLHAGSGSFDLRLVALIGIKMMRLTVRYGVASDSHVAFVFYGAMLANAMKDFQGAFRFGKLAKELSNRVECRDGRAKGLVVSTTLLLHLQLPYQQLLEDLLSAFRDGMEVGDVAASTRATVIYSSMYLWSGLPLSPLVEDTRSFLGVCTDYNQKVNALLFKKIILFLSQLQGGYDREMEEEFIEEAEREGVPMVLEAIIFHRLLIGYLFSRDLEELRMTEEEYWPRVREAKPTMFLQGTVASMYIGLAQFELYVHTRKRQYFVRATTMLKRLRQWTRKGNVTCHHMMLLLEAEKLRIFGKSAAVKAAFDSAIKSASRSGYLNHAALANERAGLFFLSKDDMDWATHYLRKAVELYDEWGATAKVSQMMEKHGLLVEASSSDGRNYGRTSSSGVVQGRTRFDGKAALIHRSGEFDLSTPAQT